MSIDTATAHGYGLRLVQGYEAEAKAYELLREHENDTIDDLCDPSDLEGWHDLIEAIDAARELLELEPIMPDNYADEYVGQGIDEWLIIDEPLEVRTEGYRDGYSDEWTAERVRICVTLGGPNAYVFTDGDRVWCECYWGGESWDGPIFGEAADLINARFAELLDL